ncbi:MAG: 16S rRNA (uracil(1498)-N(3))-methyltransferase [Candidatus Giovannonibacteria bacterium]|nr:MAG: 16S rRNA (uracil(1498)-N(3))-methyltransferase [Candidatus Giovannonibacteria bacterium]
MHRFYLPQELNKEILVVRDRSVIHQIKDVLKIRKGEQAAFFSGAPEDLGFDFVFELKNIEAGSAAFMLRGKLENTREPSKKLILYQSLIKKDKFELVLEKAVEVGVSEIVPVISARSEKKSLNTERCAAILKEASEQSGRAIIPKLHKVLSFERAVSQAQASGARTYFISTSEKENMIRGAGDRQINLFVGPEGGWEEQEIFAAGRANFEIISLGRLTFRSETAAVVAAYTLLWG